MERTRTLIVGAGISGLACADRLGERDYMIVEAEDEIGGYCRTVKRNGFVWDYSGHFFHFRHPEIEKELVGRMDGRVLRIERDSRIWYADRFIDFPFQKNIHQLPDAEYQECVRDLKDRPPEHETASFEEMLYARYGRGIADKFLVPYNEKLYATNLAALDVDAMGRFFPHASAEQILSQTDQSKREGYNATFTYPEGGAVQYVEALAKGVRTQSISLGERVTSIDVARRVATTSERDIGFDTLISTAPLASLLRMCGIDHDGEAFDWNRVLVFNLGFDAKGLSGVHWIYYPQRELCFYRVGFYDNIFEADRMSLYVEIGLSRETEVGLKAGEGWLPRVLTDLQTCGVVTDESLVASHHVLLDPAYVHITTRSIAETKRTKALLSARGVYSIGRYGSWRYCSIEDNIVEARALIDELL
ncbi:MAG: FAD-dependent oxidoreductase [Myxococcales bacterium]|nr:FAD-dependent oxidoreductase [Myxococcales bacterium]